MTLGILFLILIPPYATPDENAHFASAYQVSNDILHTQSGKTEDNIILMRQCDVDAAYTKDISREYIDYILGNAFHLHEDTGLVEHQASITKVSDVMYLPAAIGLVIGRLLQLGSVTTMLLGGLFNVVFFVLCVYYAMRLLPYGKKVLFVFALLPMTLQQTSSYSYDNIILSVLTVVVALSLHWAYSGDTIKKREVVVYLLASYVLLIGKGGTYALVCFLPFVLKYTREKLNRKNIAILAAFLLFAVIVVCSGKMIQLYTTAGAAADTSEYAGRTYIAWADSYSYTLRELLHPKLLFTILVTTILANADFYLESMIGSPLGWLNVYLPDVLIYAFLAVLLIASIRVYNEKVYLRKGDQAIIWLMCLAACGISLAAMLLYWTPQGWFEIKGVQGRYFLPMLLPFALSLRGRKMEYKEESQVTIISVLLFLELIMVFYLLKAFM